MDINVLFESLFLTNLLNITVVRNFEGMLRQTLNHSRVEFCNFVQLYILVKRLARC
jgi:hypothetical protein